MFDVQVLLNSSLAVRYTAKVVFMKATSMIGALISLSAYIFGKLLSNRVNNKLQRGVHQGDQSEAINFKKYYEVNISDYWHVNLET